MIDIYWMKYKLIKKESQNVFENKGLNKEKWDCFKVKSESFIGWF